MTTAAPHAYHVIVGWNAADDIAVEPTSTWVATGETPSEHGQIRVLLVDDEPVILEALQELLIDCGFDVVGAAADGDEGVQQSTDLLPDVVIMDVRMRVMDGIEATRRIRRALPNVQVVVVSAYDDRSLRQSAHAAGAHSYMLKGTAVENIERAIVEAARAPKKLVIEPVEEEVSWSARARGPAE